MKQTHVWTKETESPTHLRGHLLFSSSQLLPFENVGPVLLDHLIFQDKPNKYSHFYQENLEF